MTYEEKARKENNLFSRYSGLLAAGINERVLKEIYKGICSGKLYYGRKEMNRYLDLLAEKGELLNFISFLRDVDDFRFDVTYGEDKMIDAVADTYSHSTTVTYGFGMAEPTRRGSDAAARVGLLIHEIEFNYAHKIKQEQAKRDAAHMAWVDTVEAERKVVSQKVQQYMDALKKWNSKDCYWKSANIQKRPIPANFGVTEENLIDFGFYSDENKFIRYNEYEFAMKQYQQANSWLKQLIFRGKTAPVPQEYGLTMDDVIAISAGFGEDYSGRSR